MSKLNEDVLKRTAGMLAEIDNTLSNITNAERVDRLLSSAAPKLATYLQSDHMVPGCEYDDNGEHLEFFSDGPHTGTCECDEIIVTEFDPEYPDLDPSQFGMRECQFYDPSKEETFWWWSSPWHLEGSAAPFGCGHPGCACEGIMSPFPEDEDHRVSWLVMEDTNGTATFLRGT